VFCGMIGEEYHLEGNVRDVEHFVIILNERL
jgi:hypothetical protein